MLSSDIFPEVHGSAHSLKAMQVLAVVWLHFPCQVVSMQSNGFTPAPSMVWLCHTLLTAHTGLLLCWQHQASWCREGCRAVLEPRSWCWVSSFFSRVLQTSPGLYEPKQQTHLLHYTLARHFLNPVPWCGSRGFSPQKIKKECSEIRNAKDNYAAFIVFLATVETGSFQLWI